MVNMYTAKKVTIKYCDVAKTTPVSSLQSVFHVSPIYHQNIYRKHPQISRTLFQKIVAQNRGCGLSAGTFQKGAVHFSGVTLFGGMTERNGGMTEYSKTWSDGIS